MGVRLVSHCTGGFHDLLVSDGHAQFYPRHLPGCN
jgi:hypothetical protein